MTVLVAAKPWYKQWWGILLTIGLFYILVPYLVWTKTNWSNLAKSAVTGACVLVLIMMGMSANATTEEQRSLLNQARAEYTTGNIDRAAELANKAVALTSTKPEDLIKLESDITKAKVEQTQIQADSYIKKTLAEMSDSDYQLLLNDKLKTSFVSHPALNTKFIAQLEAKASMRAQYQNEIKQAADKAKIDAIISDMAQKAEARKKLVEKYFSPWDGSHYGLTRMIKESMNDPSSYEHVSTTYQDKQDYLIVTTTFRGKNAFGTLILKTVKAKVSLDGNVLEIIDQ